MDFYTTILTKIVRMISTKQRAAAICALAIVAVLVLFASAPLIATHQASAFWGGGWGGWGGGWGGWGGGCCGCGWGGWGW
jgi:hypothetical protein